MRLSSSPRAAQHGFSLLEVLVAFAIMALALGVLYNATGSTVRSVSDLEMRERATSIAESTLQRVDAVPQAGLSQSGTVGDIRWNLQTQPYESGAQMPMAPKLHQLQVTVSWVERGEPKQLILTTLRPERGVRNPGAF